MRVTHLTRFYHPHVGGTENHIADLIEVLSGAGIESSVLCTDRRATTDGPLPSVPVVRLPSAGPDTLPIPYKQLHRAFRLLDDAQIVHVHDLRFGLELAVLAGRRRSGPATVLTSHGFLFHTDALRPLKALAWQSYYRLVLRSFDAIVCVSMYDAEHCARIGLVDNVSVIPNPVRTKPFEAIRPLPARNGSLLYYGRLAPNKGIERLAPLLRLEPGLSLTIVGHGQGLAADLRRVFAPFGERVHFAGALSDQDLAATLARHDCIVLPSRAEGFGLTVIESLASGVPVVASDIPAYREIWPDWAPGLVNFDRPADVADAIRSARDGWPADRARSYAHEFSWERRGGEYLELYERVVRR